MHTNFCASAFKVVCALHELPHTCTGSGTTYALKVHNWTSRTATSIAYTSASYVTLVSLHVFLAFLGVSCVYLGLPIWQIKPPLLPKQFCPVTPPAVHGVCTGQAPFDEEHVIRRLPKKAQPLGTFGYFAEPVQWPSHSEV